MQLLLIGMLLVVNLKLVLLQRYAAAWRSRSPSDPGRQMDLEKQLLPTQRRDLERIRHAVFNPHLDEEARLVQVEGRWGEGKSFLLNRLERYLHLHPETAPDGSNRPDPAVVVVDVWKHQAEPDLHLAVLDELLSHPCYLAGFGWLSYPVMLVGGRYLGNLLLKVPLFGSSGGGLDVGVTLPRLPWQRSLQAVVARQRRRGRRTVIILDEVDRAAHQMSQVAITLTRRALDLAGVTIVLPFVDNLIRYKAFNPLLAEPLPDLGSSMDAEIYEEMMAIRSDGGPTLDGSIESVVGTLPLPDGASPQTLPQTLAVWYRSTPPGTRARLQRRFSEKFLGIHPIRLGRLSHEDVAQMLGLFDSLRKLVEDVGGTDTALNKETVVAGLDSWASKQKLGTRSPPVRALEGEVARVLRAAEDAPTQHRSPATLAAFVIVAFDNALRMSR